MDQFQILKLQEYLLFSQHLVKVFKVLKGGEKDMEKAMIVNNKSCSVCAIGAACLADGPIPDFEIAGVSAIFTAFG